MHRVGQRNDTVLPAADPERALAEVDETIGLVDTSTAVRCSAKAGIGIEEILEGVVKNFPAPKDADDEPLRALIFDSWFDPYQGVIAFCRVFEGKIQKGKKIRLHHVGKEFEVQRIGAPSPPKTTHAPTAPPAASPPERKRARTAPPAPAARRASPDPNAETRNRPSARP